MANSYFQFQQFRIEQSGCAMKVGTDGVLLGAWANVDDDCNILDIGTGSGLIALMVAQRNSSAKITGIDIDEGAVRQATENVEESKWKERIDIRLASLQEFSANNTEQFSHIISNPPFFQNSLKAPDKARSTARHTDTLSFSELVECVSKLLVEDGRFSVILPYESKEEIIKLGENNSLNISRITTVFPKADALPKRVLIEMKKAGKCECANDCITLETETRNVLTPEFKELTKDYYLKR